MDDVKVSVCMVTYNHERFIAQAVESVLAQVTSFPIELVIGEDCSTDGTRAILRELADQNGDRIRLRLADSNQGAKANFIATFGACRGQYVALLEGDDYWTCTQKLQLQVEALDARPDWATCFHPAIVVFEDKQHEPQILPDNWTRPEAVLTDLFKSNFIPTSSVLFRNRLYAELPKWFHESKLGDWPLHILNAAHGNIGFMPDVMSVYRVHSHGIWSSMDIGAQLALTFKMLTDLDHHFAGKYTREIDENRLLTLSWLVSQINEAKGLPSEIAVLKDVNARLREDFDSLKMYYESKNFPQEIAALQETVNRLAGKHQELKVYQDAKELPPTIVALNEAYQRLAVENRSLKAFQDSWRQSLTYRLAREAQRPFHQLWKKVQRLLHGKNGGPPPSSSDSILKAA